MTLPAEADHIPAQKFLLRRGMSLVAAQAPFLVHKGPVDPVLTERVVHHGAVAAPAQFIAGPFRFKRGGRGRRFMALNTAFIGNRGVYVVKKDPSYIGTMRVMAGRAVCLGHWIIRMLFDKSRVVRFVTLSAEGNKLILQQMIRFSRRVWLVTVQASSFHRAVFELGLSNSISQGLMAAKTELISSLQEICLVV